MIEIYSIMSQKYPYENILLFSPFTIFLIIGVVICTKEFLNLEERTRRDIIEYFIKIFFAIVVFIFMISHLAISWFKFDEYVNVIKDNKCNIVEGYAENISTYIVKDGGEGVETVFFIEGTKFDTGNSYGMKNKILLEDIELIKHNYVVVKYFTDTDINGEYNVVLEILTEIQEDGSSECTGDG